MPAPEPIKRAKEDNTMKAKMIAAVFAVFALAVAGCDKKEAPAVETPAAPETPAVTVEVPAVTVEAPAVTVEVPAVPAPETKAQ